MSRPLFSCGEEISSQPRLNEGIVPEKSLLGVSRNIDHRKSDCILTKNYMKFTNCIVCALLCLVFLASLSFAASTLNNRTTGTLLYVIQ